MSYISSCDYVADETALSPSSFDITTPYEAYGEVENYLTQRVEAVTQENTERPVIMLSGGIDSIILTAITARIRPDVLAITFHQESQQSHEEVQRAQAVAQHLGIEHIIASPRGEDMKKYLTDTSQRLGSTEPWEVLAGVTWRIVDDISQKDNAYGPILSGAGADVLFLGGKDIGQDREGLVYVWDNTMRDQVEKNFTRNRFIPDFYERVIDNPQRYVLAWQTHEAVELAQRIHPRVVRGENLEKDKKLFYDLAYELWIPKEILEQSKSPLQISSGGLDSVVKLARHDLSVMHKGKTYTDPHTEDLELTVARLYLENIALKNQNNEDMNHDTVCHDHQYDDLNQNFGYSNDQLRSRQADDYGF